MKKILWIYWSQGFDNAPYLVQKCLSSWERHNSDTWDIRKVSDDNIDEYVTDGSITKICASKQITKASISDIVRIQLLKRHGGLWVDATTCCVKPLDDWLNEYVQNGFFAFKHSNDRILASWFLYADECNYIAGKMYEAVVSHANTNVALGSDVPHVSIDEWKQEVPHDHYFWFHYLFGDLYIKDDVFKENWDNVIGLDAGLAHLVYNNEQMQAVTKKIKEKVATSESPVFKLSHRYNHVDDSNSVLSYLFSVH